jgi:hypothetical protein
MIERPNYQARYTSDPPRQSNNDYIDNNVDYTTM